MKKRNYFKVLILAITTVFFFSCNSTDDDGTENGNGSGNEPQVTSISIQANATTIDLGGTISFTVKDNNNVIVSVQSTIYFDGSEISGFVHTPESVGVFQVHATYEGFTAQSINITVNEPPRVVYASSDSYTKLLGEGFTFTALTNGGENITSEAVFYIDGAEISGNEYTPAGRGRHALTALYDGVTSDEVFVTIGYVQKVLVEDYTGAWCGYCPRLAYNLEEAENGDINVIGVAIHNGDAMAYEYEANLRAEYNVNGFPSGRINRNITWNESVSQISAYAAGVNGNLGLGLETSLSGSTISVDVKVAYVNTVNNAKIVVYLTEDNLIYSQVNYMNNNSSSPWYQAGNPIVNFVHNNVLRKTPTDIFGDAMPNAVDGDEYTDSFTFSVPASVQNTDNLEIVAFIIGSNGTVINSQRVSLGDSQDYQ